MAWKGFQPRFPRGAVGEESSPGLSPGAGQGAASSPCPQLPLPRCTSAHPGDGQHASTIPAHLSPCRARGWQMVLLGGRGGLLLPPRAGTSLPAQPGMGATWCCPPGNAGLGGRQRLIGSRWH